MSVATIKRLAAAFVERSETLGYKGKKRDDAAIDFFCGAAVALELAASLDEAKHVHLVNALSISVRGFMAVKQLAASEAN